MVSPTTIDIDFDEVFRTARPDLIAYAARRGAHDAELMADLALTDCFRALGRLRSHHPKVILAYLYRAMDSHLARERTTQRAELRDDLEEVSGSASFEDGLVSDVDLDDLLDTLSPSQGQALRLRLVDNLRAEEVGRRMGKSADAVRQLQHQGLRRLRRLGFGAALAVLAVAGLVAALVAGNATPDQSPATSTPATSTPTTSTPATSMPETTVIGPGPGPAPLERATTVPSEASPEPPSTPASGSSSTIETVDVDDDPPTRPAGAAGSPVRLIAYDGFDLGLGDGTELVGPRAGATAAGFADGGWETVEGSLKVIYDAVGLGYVDADGVALRTSPGALRLQSTEAWSTLARPLTDPPPIGTTVWVSYLVRLEGDPVDDLFWTPRSGEPAVSGAFGVQNVDRFRFVNGASSDLTIEPGRTYLLVARFRADGASLWVNPSLDRIGSPAVEIDHALQMGTAPGFGVFDRADGDVVYTLDEYRIGASYADVAPPSTGG